MKIFYFGELIEENGRKVTNETNSETQTAQLELSFAEGESAPEPKKTGMESKLDMLKTSLSRGTPSSDEIVVFSDKAVPTGTTLEKKRVDHSGSGPRVAGILGMSSVGDILKDLDLNIDIYHPFQKVLQ